MQAGQRTTGRYQLIVGPVGAPQRLVGRRRPARARVVRHLAQAREDRHGAHAHAAALLRPRQRPVRRDLDLSVHGGDPHAPVLRSRRDAHADRPVGRGAGALPGSPPLPVGSLPGPPPLPIATSDTLVWSPSGAPCGRPIDQWSMGGISIPAGTAGFLAPCASDDQLAQAGPWATTLHHGAVHPRRDGRRPDHRHRVRERDHRRRPSSSPSSRRSPRVAPPTPDRGCAARLAARGRARAGPGPPAA